MINQIGNYSLYIALILSLIIIFQSYFFFQKSSKTSQGKLFSLIAIQTLDMAILGYSHALQEEMGKDSN